MNTHDLAGISTVPSGAVSTPSRILPYSVFTPKTLSDPTASVSNFPTISVSAMQSTGVVGDNSTMTMTTSSKAATGSLSMTTKPTGSASGGGNATGQTPSPSASHSSAPSAGAQVGLLASKGAFAGIAAIAVALLL